MKSLRKIPALLCSLALAALSAAPQQKPAPPVPQEDAQVRIVREVNLVVVPVTVKDGDAHLVVDLRKEEFRIFEDNVEQNLDAFSNDPFPLSIVVLIDNELPKSTAQQVQSSLPAIVSALSDRDEVFVCRFDVNFHPGKGFTRDTDKLLTELKRTTLASEPARGTPGGPLGAGPTINGLPAPGAPQTLPGSQKMTSQRIKALDDAVYEASELLKDRGRDRRKMVLLISDGENVKKYKYTFDDAVKKLLEANISVFCVGVGEASYRHSVPIVPHRSSPLPRYANSTGGDVFYAAKRDSLEDVYSRATEEARNQYTLAYVPRGTDRSIDYHSIEVRVKRPGLTIRTRDGYYVPSIR